MKTPEVPRLRVRDVFASMHGREAGPRRWRGNEPRAESSLYRTGDSLCMDQKWWSFLASQNGGGPARRSPIPLRTGIKAHTLHKEITHLG
jgi:hypothetical protein